MEGGDLSKGQYPVMEQFNTLQGEGYNAGKPAYFIRLAGCDVGCTWCDVKESWSAEEHPVKDTGVIVEHALASGSPNVVITGGEPCMYQLNDLTSSLKEHDINTWLETSGAHPISGDWDWLVLSPKKFKACLPESYSKAHELKLIIANRNDFKWAEKHRDLVSDDCLCYLQPEWSRKEKLLPLIIEYIKTNPHWNLSLQSHKYIDIP